MPKPTRLRVTSERPIGPPEEGSPLADSLAATLSANIDESAKPNGRQALSADQGAAILARLRELEGREEEHVKVIQTLADQKGAADRAAALAAENAESEITKAYEQARAAVEQTRVQAANSVAKAEAGAQQRAGVLTAVALGALQKLAEQANWLIAFLFRKAPLLAVLYGGYLLWDANLATPTPTKLVGLALYGFCCIAPCAWLASRAD